MDSAVYTAYRYSGRAGTGSRLRWALAVSVFSHLLFLAALVSEVPQRRAQVIGPAPILVRLEQLPQVPAAGPAVADPDESPLPRRIERRAAASGGEGPATPLSEMSAMTHGPAAPLSLPQVPDPTVYTARDLDSYPRPVVPLDYGRFVERAAGMRTATVRFELIIDEHGIVNDVAFVQSEPPGYADEQLRGLLAAARFVPAYKDRRAVKSRVVLSIDFEPGDR